MLAESAGAGLVHKKVGVQYVISYDRLQTHVKQYGDSTQLNNRTTVHLIDCRHIRKQYHSYPTVF